MHCSYGVADTVCVAHVGAKTAGPAHLNSAASAKEAIRAMEAEKQERADREAGIVPASMRGASTDRDAPRPRGRRYSVVCIQGPQCVQ